MATVDALMPPSLSVFFGNLDARVTDRILYELGCQVSRSWPPDSTCVSHEQLARCCCSAVPRAPSRAAAVVAAAADALNLLVFPHLPPGWPRGTRAHAARQGRRQEVVCVR